MSYDVNFPSKAIGNIFRQKLTSVSSLSLQNKIVGEVEKLSDDPRPHGRKIFKQMKPPVLFYRYTAQYRIRIGDYRVLYDIDDKKKIVWILALRRRSEKTYK